MLLHVHTATVLSLHWLNSITHHNPIPQLNHTQQSNYSTQLHLTIRMTQLNHLLQSNHTKLDHTLRSNGSPQSHIAIQWLNSITHTLQSNGDSLTHHNPITQYSITHFNLKKEDEFLGRPEVKIVMPDELKQKLVEDWDFVAQQHKVVMISHCHFHSPKRRRRKDKKNLYTFTKKRKEKKRKTSLSLFTCSFISGCNAAGQTTSRHDDQCAAGAVHRAKQGEKSQDRADSQGDLCWAQGEEINKNYYKISRREEKEEERLWVSRSQRREVPRQSRFSKRFVLGSRWGD